MRPVKDTTPSVPSRLGKSRWIIATLLAVAVLSACTSDTSGGGDEGGADEPTAPTPAEPTPAEPMRLDVLVYNVEYSGDESTDAVIRELDADIVGVLESYNRLPEIAENTGYPYYNVSLQVLSKYPIHESSGADGLYALIEVRPGEVVAFFNHHLDYVRYGPRLLDKGMSVEDVIASENEVRTSALEWSLEAMGPLIAQGYPVFLTGDFNEPSSLDYGEDTVGTRPGIDEPVPWPVSEVLLETGFRDTYRDIHPDPLENPGITHRRSGDRIDYLYAAGPSETLESQLVGKQGAQDVAIGFEAWTSDHYAVLSTFEVTPVSMPTMVSVDAALKTEGDPLVVSYRAPGGDNSIAIVPSGGAPDQPAVTEDATGSSGALELATAQLGLEPGGYDVVLTDANGSELARVGFWLRGRGVQVRLSTDQATYEVGEPITASWTDGPANRWDWIGVYKAAKSDPKVHWYLLWGYTGLHASGTLPPTVSGSMTIGPDSQGGPWPLPPGDYIVHYLLTDRYRSAASTSFEVTT
jgi:endonuclease/exonuclease/phosphatase family metal-dependent hydrolase